MGPLRERDMHAFRVCKVHKGRYSQTYLRLGIFCIYFCLYRIIIYLTMSLMLHRDYSGISSRFNESIFWMLTIIIHGFSTIWN
jgi:hypothetical protein